MRVKKIHRLLRILFVLGAASVILACPGESSSDNGTTGSTSTDISTLTLSYSNVTGLKDAQIDPEISPEWEGGGLPEVTYTIDPALPDGLAIDANSGVISGTPTAVQAAQEYTVTATGVEPAYTGTNTAKLSISVVETPISLDTFNTFSYEAIEGIENVALTATGPTWGDGDAPTATYAVDPALPDGLTIDETTGEISGTPTTVQAAQDYTVTATGTVAYEGTKTATVSITIQGQINLNTLTFSYADINAVESVEITATSPTWADDAAPIVTYAVNPALPDGLTINETTGEISGTPTAVQEAQDYTVTATGNGELFIGTQTATVNIVVSINLDKVFARWKEGDSYKAITEATTGTAIATVDALKNIQNDLTGTYYLTSNIDVSGAAWEPLGSTTPFTGTFNGNGYIVHGVTIEAASTDTDDQGKYQGLFAIVNNAVVKDVGIGVERVSAVGIAGALIGEARGTSAIDNVAVARMADTAEVTVSDVTVGGLVGSIINTVKVSNAYNLEMVVKSTKTGTSVSSYVGGLVGKVAGNTIHGYTFTGDDDTKTILSGKSLVGGLVGEASGAANIRGYVSGKGVIEGDGSGDVGGLVGRFGSGSIVRGYFDGGKITAIAGSIGGRIGGLVGNAGQSDTVSDTVIGYVANATITGPSSYIGGLVGWFSSGVVTGYVVDSTITSTDTEVGIGGLAGQIYNSDLTSVSGYVVGGSISGVSAVGGLVGSIAPRSGSARIGGYVAVRVTATANQTSAKAFTLDVPSGEISPRLMGYWDKKATGLIDNGSHRGTAISDIANIVYDSTTGEYTDSGNNNAVVFDNADFLTQFSLPEASATQPDLQSYRVLPYGETLSVNDTVNLVAIAPWDNTGTVTWSSSDIAVVTVDDANGEATGQGTGSATITATWSDGGTATGTATMSITVQ